MNEAGEVVAVRFHHSLNGAQQFTWRKGDKVQLYGLWRLREIQEAGWVLLVEGESDCWTCWPHGIPALGLPGKSIWKPAWTELLKGLTVYLWQEPDAPELPGKLFKAYTFDFWLRNDSGQPNN
jgi:putative DNA primase/helicase